MRQTGFYRKMYEQNFGHIRKVGPETRDCWWDPRPKIRDPFHTWDPGPETRDPKCLSRDLRPEVQLIGGTRDYKRGTQDPRPETLEVIFHPAAVMKSLNFQNQ